MKSVLDYIEKNGQRFEDELFELLRIPSVSTDSSKKGDIQKAADFLVNKFKPLNPKAVKKYETKGHPIVYAELEGPKDAPTILVYGHYDVQPPDPLEKWNTPPFEPTVVDGKVYARGASDDKGQALTHVQAVASIIESGEKLPVNLKFILEGEEEIGSPNLVPFIKEHKEMLTCDMVLVSDTSMFAMNTPSITYGLRGLAYMEIHVDGPNRDLHSGVYGGAIVNPANVLSKIIAQLTDENGRITVPGFYDDVLELSELERKEYKQLPFDEEKYKADLGVEDVDGEVGFSTLERASGRPTLDVNGLWSGYQGEGAKTVLPAQAGAKVSMRLVPNQEPGKIAKLFAEHVESLAPKGVKVRVEEHHGGYPAMTDLGFYGLKAAAEAFEEVYGKKPLFCREGGSIPIVAEFKKILDADTILMGFGLNSDALHSPNEHFHLVDYHRGIKTSAMFMGLVSKYK